MRPINSAGIALIKSFEGFRAEPYTDSGGLWTIGYGHTQGVTPASPAITQVQAEALLRQDIKAAQMSVERFAPAALTDNQYASLVSLIYNVGTLPLQKTLGQKLRAGDMAGAAAEFLRWDYADGSPSNGLLRRRMAEKALFEQSP